MCRRWIVLMAGLVCRQTAQSGADWLFDPHSVQHFSSHYREQQPLHIARGAPSFYQQALPIGLSDIDRLIQSTQH